MSIVQEFYSIAGAVLSGERRVPSIQVTSVDLTTSGPRVRWTGGPVGHRAVSTEDGTQWRGGVDPQWLLGGLSRYLAVRWRVRSAVTLPGWSERLVERYPKVLTSGGPYVRPGWSALVATGAEWIETVGIPERFETVEIKEKFGTLRWQFQSDEVDGYVADVVEAIETLSGHICDICGGHGLTRGNSWISTRCGAHVEDR